MGGTRNLNYMVHMADKKQTELVQTFLLENPDIEAVELLVSDINGVMRGKWAPKNTLTKIVDPGVNLPMSVFALDVWGREVDGTGLHIESGDLDGFCRLAGNRLGRATWAKQPTAQAFLHMMDEKGKPFFADPRNLLEALLKKMKRKGLNPVVAFELEFYLVDPKSYEANGKLSKDEEAAHGANGPDAQEMYSLTALREHSALFADIREAATEHDLPIDTIIKEAAPGQFELNLNHRNDALAAADDAVLLRRIITECAFQHGVKASFMAKPFLDWPGNGMHVHASILDGDGNNIFGGKAGEKRLRAAAAGLLEHVEDCLLMFISSYNGFRRLQAGSYAPTNLAWGYNNRSVAVRVPASDEKAARLEHRISGADANPYLVLISILGAMLDGLERNAKPPKAVSGNAYDKKLPALIGNMENAIAAFEHSKFTDSLFGKRMKKVIIQVKRQELETFQNEISLLERSTYL